MNDKRQHQRFPFSESVGYQKSEEMPLVGSLSEDISRMGLKLNVNEFIPVNTTLELQVHLPGQVQMAFMTAKVVWIREHAQRLEAWQVGLQLIDDGTLSSELENYIKFLRLENT